MHHLQHPIHELQLDAGPGRPCRRAVSALHMDLSVSLPGVWMQNAGGATGLSHGARTHRVLTVNAGSAVTPHGAGTHRVLKLNAG